MKIKNLIALALSVCLMAGSLPVTVFGVQFSDIRGHWAEGTIQTLADEGIINGRGGGMFQPNDQITRAEFFALINRLFSFKNEAEINFSDVPSDAWFISDIKKAVAAGYTVGYPDNTMRPNANINRGEVAVVLCGILDISPDAEGAEKFNDSENIPDWAKPYVGAAAAAGLVVGDENGNYRANDFMTRAEAATVLKTSREYNNAQDQPTEEQEEQEEQEEPESEAAKQPIRYSGGVGGGGGGTPTPEPPEPPETPETPVTGISISDSSLIIESGQSAVLTAAIEPDDATSKTLKWSSDNPEVADVSSKSGTEPVSLITRETGTAVITAEAANGIKASCVVTVITPIIQSSPEPGTTYYTDVIIQAGEDEIVFDNVTFLGNIRIEEAQTNIPPVVVRRFTLPFAAGGRGQITFSNNSRVDGRMRVNTGVGIKTAKGTRVPKIDITSNDAQLDLEGEVDNITVENNVVLDEIRVAEDSAPVVTGEGAVSRVAVRGSSAGAAAGITITTIVTTVEITTATANATVGTVNIGGNNVNTVVTIGDNVTVDHMLISDTAAPLIDVNSGGSINIVTSVVTSEATNSTMIIGDGAVNTLQTTLVSTTLVVSTVAVEPDRKTIEPELIGLSIGALPSKTTYLVQESLNLSGLTVLGRYQLPDLNPYSQVITGYRTEPVTGTILTIPGNTRINVSYNGIGTEFTVTVREADKNNIRRVMADANNAKAGVVTRENASGLAAGTNWVTSAEMTAFNSVISSAQSVITNVSAAQATVDEAAAALSSAIATFNSQKKQAGSEPANKTELKAAIQRAGDVKKPVVTSMDGRDIEPEKSWVTPMDVATLNDAIRAAEAVNNNAAATQSEADTVLSTLNQAITTFMAAIKPGTKPIEKEALLKAITAANNAKAGVGISVDGSDFSQETDWVTSAQMSALNNAISAAESVYNSGTRQSEYDAAVTTITNAISTFNGQKKKGTKAVNKVPLSTAIANASSARSNTVISANGLDVPSDRHWVTSAQMTALTSAIAAAEAVNSSDSATQTAVNEAVTALNSALATFNSQLKLGTFVDKSTLVTAIASANALKNSTVISVDGTDVATDVYWVTQAQMTALNNALTAAENLNTSTTATQGQVYSAVATLNNAVTVLNSQRSLGTKVDVVDKTALASAISSASTLRGNTLTSVDGTDIATDKYWVTAEQMTAFTSAISAAEAVNSNSAATQAQVESAASALATAVSAFNTQRTLGTKQEIIAVTGVTVSPKTLNLLVGQTSTLTATVAPETATNKNVTWSSSSEAVTVTDGTVKAVSPGSATITVTTEDGAKTDTCTVTVAAVPVTPTPATDLAVVQKMSDTQATVKIKLKTAMPNMTWKVYNAATGAAEVSGVTASAPDAGNILELTHATDIPIRDYYVTAKATDKTESQRLKITVKAYADRLVTWATPADRHDATHALGTNSITEGAVDVDGYAGYTVVSAGLPYHFNGENQLGLWYGLIISAPDGVTQGVTVKTAKDAALTSSLVTISPTLKTAADIIAGGRTEEDTFTHERYLSVYFDATDATTRYIEVNWGGAYDPERYKVIPSITKAAESNIKVESWEIDADTTLPDGNTFNILDENDVNIKPGVTLKTGTSKIVLNGTAYIGGDGAIAGNVELASGSFSSDGGNSAFRVGSTGNDLTITDDRTDTTKSIQIFPTVKENGANVTIKNAKSVIVLAKNGDNDTIGNLTVTKSTGTGIEINENTKASKVKVIEFDKDINVKGTIENLEVGDSTDSSAVKIGAANVAVQSTGIVTSTVTVNKISGTVNIYGEAKDLVVGSADVDGAKHVEVHGGSIVSSVTVNKIEDTVNIREEIEDLTVGTDGVAGAKFVNIQPGGNVTNEILINNIQNTFQVFVGGEVNCDVTIGTASHVLVNEPTGSENVNAVVKGTLTVNNATAVEIKTGGVVEGKITLGTITADVVIHGTVGVNTKPSIDILEVITSVRAVIVKSTGIVNGNITGTPTSINIESGGSVTGDYPGKPGEGESTEP